MPSNPKEVRPAANRVKPGARKPRISSSQHSKRTVANPSMAEIAERAYAYWESRGFEGGSAQDDWFRAERELLEKQSNAVRRKSPSGV